MTAADASLIIAVGLVFGAAVCRLIIWAQSAGEHRAAVARTYLTPLADWGLVASAGHALSLMLTGDPAVTAWATTAILACLALALRTAAPDATPAPEEPPATPPEPAAIAPLTPPSLWTQTDRDSSRLPPAR
jgi:hypothetical protein